MSASIVVRNVNEAIIKAMIKFKALWEGLKAANSMSIPSGRIIAPRGMNTLELDGPVVTEYRSPTERVVFMPERDANPFFHLMEALWIIAGRNDVEWLSFFNSNIANYSDDGKVFHAPYGYRLRYSHSMFHGKRAMIDQIETAISMLKDDRDSRQVVMQIWEAGLDLNADSKDIPCNDLVMLKIREGKLNMTVANRSNDVIWGAYGANVVQFSMLQEYIAARIGVGVGIYYQVSDSFHVYTDNPVLEKIIDKRVPLDYYADGLVEPTKMVNGSARLWDLELRTFMTESHTQVIHKQRTILQHFYTDAFFRYTVIPMFNSWLMHKTGQRDEALLWLESMPENSDWGLAAREWLERRYNK